MSPWQGVQSGEWSCARCPERIPVGSGWRLQYRTEDGHDAVMLVGPVCARELMPVRATIDLVALQRRRDEIPPLTSLVDHVLGSRRDPPRYELRLRGADVHLLSELHEETPAQFAMRLRDTGLLLSL